MQAYEVRVVDEDGDLSDAYFIQCRDLVEASLMLREQHADAAILVRALHNHAPQS